MKNSGRPCAITVGHPEWVDDPRFCSNSQRVLNRTEVTANLQDIFGTQPLSHWLSAFKQRGIPCAPINSVKQALHIGAGQGQRQRASKSTAFRWSPALEIGRFAGDSTVHAPPQLGDHTREIHHAGSSALISAITRRWAWCDDATRAATRHADQRPSGQLDASGLRHHRKRLRWPGVTANSSIVGQDQADIAGQWLLPEIAGIIDADGAWITPALIDCHTHLVFAGNRAEEFEQRLQGVSYTDIAKAGGGILSTRASRPATADEDALFAQSLPRLQALIADGVACVEIKSGYGLDLDNERKMLRVAAVWAMTAGITVKTTYLGRACAAAGIRRARR